MGNKSTKYRFQIHRKRNLNEILHFLIQLSAECEGNDNSTIINLQLKLILRECNEFVKLLIDLFKNLEIINKRNLNAELITVIDVIFYNIKDIGDILVILLRNMILGQKYFDSNFIELEQVRQMYQQEISDIKRIFYTIPRHIKNAIYITRPTGQYIFLEELRDILLEVNDYLMMAAHNLVIHQQSQENIKEEFHRIMKIVNRRYIRDVYFLTDPLAGHARTDFWTKLPYPTTLVAEYQTYLSKFILTLEPHVYRFLKKFKRYKNDLLCFILLIQPFGKPNSNMETEKSKLRSFNTVHEVFFFQNKIVNLWQTQFKTRSHVS